MASSEESVEYMEKSELVMLARTGNKYMKKLAKQELQRRRGEEGEI